VLAIAASGLGEHPIAAGALEGVDLESWVLVTGGDAGIAEQMSHGQTISQRLTPVVVRRDFGHEFWTRQWPIARRPRCWRTDELAETRRVAAMGWRRVPGRGDSQDQPAGMAAAAAWRSPPGTCCQPGK
jgi:hypothetical protein